MSNNTNSNRPSAPGTTNKLWTISNIITLGRICLVPVFVIVLVSPWPEWFAIPSITMAMKRYIAAGIFILISCTDWLDGYLARKRNEITDFGKFMDPLADKILVAAALLVLIELGSLPSWVALIILAREFIVSGVRMIAAAEGVVIAASYIGKFKTVFQMIAIVLFTIKDAHMLGTAQAAFSDTLWVVSWLVMIVALVLTVISMLDYIVKARDLIGLGSKRKEEAEYAEAILSSEEIAKRVIEAAAKKNITIGTAESLTGGLIASTLTEIPGSSSVVRGGIISYVNDVKRDTLGVRDDVLTKQGAVCADVAQDMAKGAREAIGCDITVSVTGIAGPTGAEPGKPVGTVFMGISTAEGERTKRFQFEGTRDEVREATVNAALKEVLEAVSSL